MSSLLTLSNDYTVCMLNLGDSATVAWYIIRGVLVTVTMNLIRQAHIAICLIILYRCVNGMLHVSSRNEQVAE